MRKTIAMLLILMMTISLLAACGSNNSNSDQSGSDSVDQTASEETEPEESEPENPFIGTWIGLYNGSIIVFNEDNSFTLGTSNGNWSMNDTSADVKYVASTTGKEIEMTYDILEEDGVTFLRNRAAGKSNGEAARFTVNDYYPEDKIQEIKQAMAKKLGDMVSSDIIELTVNNAELGWYAQGAQYDSVSKKVTNLNTACAPAAESAFFKANKGRTLICLDITIKNTDRSKLDTGDYIVSFMVTQNGQNATVMGYDLNDEDGRFGLNLSYAIIAEEDGDFFKNDTSNILISAGSTVRIKVVCIFKFDADLDAPFDLIVSLANSSSSTEEFLYTIE